MSATPVNNIDGDQTVSRNLAVGGDAKIKGSATIGHDLRVEGWLDAPNVRSPQKGLFPDAEALRTAYPLPQEGWWAYVGDGLPALIYIATASGWVNTNQTGGEASVDIPAIRESIEALQSSLQANENADAARDNTIAELQTSTNSIKSDVTSLGEADKELYRQLREMSENDVQKALHDSGEALKLIGLYESDLYDIQTDTVPLVNKHERTLSTYEQNISELHEADTSLSSAIRGVSDRTDELEQFKSTAEDFHARTSNALDTIGDDLKTVRSDIQTLENGKARAFTPQYPLSLSDEGLLKIAAEYRPEVDAYCGVLGLTRQADGTYLYGTDLTLTFEQVVETLSQHVPLHTPDLRGAYGVPRAAFVIVELGAAPFAFNMAKCFAGNDKVEWVVLHTTNTDGMAFENVEGMFSGCSSLRRIDGVFPLRDTQGLDTAFEGCTSLQTASFFYLQSDFDLSGCPDLTAWTLDTLVAMASNGGNPVTVAVHPDVYAKIYPQDESGRLTEWSSLATKATEKSITFKVKTT